MTFRPPPGAQSRPPGAGAAVEYGLVRETVVRDVQRGRVDAVDVCDAHPELVRAARNVGKPSGDDCPICGQARLARVTYVFGAGLPAGGRCPGTAAELDRLCRRAEPVQCYEVECCPECKWHHLLRKYPAGGVAARSTRSRRQG